jgi:MFS transporter, DHA2 family, multidrug resistance protein
MSTSIIAALKRPPDHFLYAALFCSSFIVAFNSTLTLIASPYIVGDLGGSNDIASYTISFFALGNALGIPLGKILLDKHGAARFLACGMLLFAFLSFTCAIAPNYPFFNVARFLQGFSCGPFYAFISHLSSKLVPVEKRSLFTSITLSIFTMTPVIAACWGGWIAYEWNWRYVFYFNLPLKLFLAFYLWHRLKGFDSQDPQNRNSSFDLIGYLSFFIGVFCLGFVSITGQQLDWFRSPLMSTLIVLGVLFLIYFIIWEFHHPHPILHLRMLKNPYFSFALFNLTILFSAYFGMILLLSFWLNLWVQYTPDWIAILIGAMALSGLFPMFFVSEKVHKIDNRIFLVLSIVFLAISCFHTMIFNVEINLGRIAFSRILAGIGVAFSLPPIFRICFHNFPRESHLHVLNLFQVVRALASGLGTAIYTTIWLRRQVFYHDRLGSKLTVLSPETQDFFFNAEQINLHGEAANAQLEYYLQREATSLALDDCFYMMGLILIGTLLIFASTLFLRRSGFISDKVVS